MKSRNDDQERSEFETKELDDREYQLKSNTSLNLNTIAGENTLKRKGEIKN